MLQSYLVLTPSPGRIDDLVQEYRRVGIIEAGVAHGLRRGEAIIIPATDSTPERLVITSIWADQRAYDSWLAAPERVTATVGVWPLLATGEAEAVYKVPRDTVPGKDSLPLAPVLDPVPNRTKIVITVPA